MYEVYHSVRGCGRSMMFVVLLRGVHQVFSSGENVSFSCQSSLKK